MSQGAAKRERRRARRRLAADALVEATGMDQATARLWLHFNKMQYEDALFSFKRVSAELGRAGAIKAIRLVLQDWKGKPNRFEKETEEADGE
jgi:hypothetical protein